MKKPVVSPLFLAGIFAVFQAAGQAKTDSVFTKNDLPQVLVTGLSDASFRDNSLNISALRRSDIENAAVPTLASALEKLPGVARLGSGPGIGKPVIDLDVYV